MSQKGKFILHLSAFLVLVFVCMAGYNAFGLYVASTSPSAFGKISDVTRDQGKHHVTYASIDFSAADDRTKVCHVRTWFRRADFGINEGASIRIVPAKSGCGTPWFPDHIPPPIEALAGAAVAAGVSAVFIFLLHLKRKYGVSPTDGPHQDQPFSN